MALAIAVGRAPAAIAGASASALLDQLDLEPPTLDASCVQALLRRAALGLADGHVRKVVVNFYFADVCGVEASGFTVRQDSYAVLNAFVAWDFHPDATLRLNLENISDEKYINTLRYSGYYGAPAHYTLSLDWRF